VLKKISNFESGGILMYAIIETGGKQYRVSEGDVLKVEKLDIADNETVTFDNVVLVSDGDEVSCGTPYVAKATVTADVLKTEKGKKVLVFKKKMRKGYKRLKGHRQQHTSVKITKISA
jgi:large subunit ribosomal protein L21